MKIQQRKYTPLLLLMVYISFTPLFQALYCNSCNACVVNDPCSNCCEMVKSCKNDKCSNEIKLTFSKNKCDCKFANPISIILYKVNNDFNFAIIKNINKQIDYNLELNKTLPIDLTIHYSYNPIFILNAALLI
ncbi:MAG: hypothetical protein JW866_07860 [Ignavibacteriales bacterium]|nr:hypothetical protein [Ignavibacteriales bacterium]